MLVKPLLTTLALIQAAISQQDIPFCLQSCLTEVGTSLCATDALRSLTPCLTKTCPNPPATQNLIASLDVAFTPKAEYSCQQAYGPSDSSNTESSSVTLPLNGTCATSPHGFKSYLPQGVSRIRASNACRVMVFSEEDCLGEAGSSDVGALSNGRCVFRGGRSARLTCRNELDAARAYIQSSCGNDEDDEPINEDNDSASSSSTVYPSSAPYHGPGPTSSGESTSTSIPFHWPFSTNTRSTTQSASTNTADAAAGSGTATDGSDITYTLTWPSASATASGNGSDSGNSTGAITSSPAVFPTQNATSSSSGSQNGNGTLTLTLSASPTADATAMPSYTGLAARLSGGTSIALGLVGAGFVAFL